MQDSQPQCGPRCAAEFCSRDSGTVTYYGQTCEFTLKLHEWQCQCCSQWLGLDPLSFGCFPSTPTTPLVWFDLQLLQLYQRLGLEGLSATGG